jgi:hypothetical protein
MVRSLRTAIKEHRYGRYSINTEHWEAEIMLGKILRFYLELESLRDQRKMSENEEEALELARISVADLAALVAMNLMPNKLTPQPTVGASTRMLSRELRQDRKIFAISAKLLRKKFGQRHAGFDKEINDFCRNIAQSK